ncbi:MAG: TraR/DksA family transcriptional regulator [Anaerolineae bacterium]
MDTLRQQARSRLEDELKTLQSELEELDRRLEAKGNYSLGVGDPAIYQWELNLALKQRAEQKKQEVEEALARIESSTYTVCSRCGGEIEPERLELLPTTTVCSQCAQRKK